LNILKVTLVLSKLQQWKMHRTNDTGIKVVLMYTAKRFCQCDLFCSGTVSCCHS